MAVHARDLSKEVAILFITSTTVGSNNRERTQPCPSTENWIKDLLSMAPPIRTRPSFPLSQSLPSGSFISLLSWSIRGQTDSKPQSQKTKSNWSHGPQPYLTQWNYEPGRVGPPKMDRSWWRVLTKHGPLEKGMANHFNILPWEPMKGIKRQKYVTLKDELPRLVGAQYATGDQWRNNSRKNEGMEPKWKHHHHLWMWLLMEVKVNAVKKNVS